MNKTEIEFKYDDDFKPKYINGAVGNISNKGEFIMDLYYESLSKPDSSTLEILDEGNIQETINYNNKIIRKVETSVIMDINTAKEICNWLQGLIKEFEKE